jgi:hypothetical protein
MFFLVSGFLKNSQPTGNYMKVNINPLTPELNPSAQRCRTRFFAGDFAY